MKITSRLLVLANLALRAAAQSFWYENIQHQGLAPFAPGGASYQVFRNVKDFGARGDGVTDDTAAINAAIQAGGPRCVPGQCASSTQTPAVVYFPAGTYIISSSIIPSYYTQLYGNPNNKPILKAKPGSGAFTLIDANPYVPQYLAYGSTNVFYRQIRNFVIDLTSAQSNAPLWGIHWPTAQATSLQNLEFRLSAAPDTAHIGLFIESGSGGFLGDLTFNGGLIGAEFGNQQFTTRNLVFNNAKVAIHMFWDWGWTYKSISINNCGTGIEMDAGGPTAQEVGSVTFVDGSISNTPVGIKTSWSSASIPAAAGSLTLENVQINNVATVVQGANGAVALAGSSGSQLIGAWGQGHSYTPTGGPTRFQGNFAPFPRPAGLLSGSKYYERSKPQYQNVDVSQFVSVRSSGARGDANTDDTAAINRVIASATAAGKIVFFDYGIYKVTNTIVIPPGARILGETFSVILAAGPFFGDLNNPKPVVQVGTPGQSGNVEWSDMIVSTQGANPGAILIQWNLASAAGNPSGMWDVHTRIGGFRGSNLQVAQCPTGAPQPNTACIAAFQSMQITKSATGLYLENVWLWVADHDIEDSALTRITVYAGRGISVESTQGNIWLVGTSSEHHNLYQYQFANTQNIFMAQLQTETPYYQPAPDARVPFPVVAARDDPDFGAYCAGKSGNCADAWGLRILNSKNMLIYGAGLYSFFDNYSVVCSQNSDGVYNEYCQTQIFGIDEGGPAGSSYSGSTVYLYNLVTIGVVSMINRNGQSVALQIDNRNTFGQSIALYRTN